MMKKLGLLTLVIFIQTFGIFAEDPDALTYLQLHSQDWPQKVTLIFPAVFDIKVEGKVLGTAVIPAKTQARVVAVLSTGLILEANGQQGEVAPEQTNFFELLHDLRSARDSAPAVVLQLPKNSDSASWYQAQISDVLDPWLQANPGKAHFEEVAAKMAPFAAELARVAIGDIRRKARWFTAEEVAANATGFELDALFSQMKDATDQELLQLLPEIKKYERDAAHPKLLQACITLLETRSGTLTPERVKVDLESSKSQLQMQKEKMIIELKSMLNHPAHGTSVPTHLPGEIQGDDQLYRPAGTYIHPAQYPDFGPYYPNPSDLFLAPTEEQLVALRSRLDTINALAKQSAAVDQELLGVDEAVKKKLALLAEAKLPLAAQLQQEQAALAQLNEIKAPLEAGDLTATQNLVQENGKKWPDNMPAVQLYTAELPKVAQSAQVAFDNANTALVERHLKMAQYLFSMVPPSSPELDPIRISTQLLGKKVEYAKSFASLSYQQLVELPINAASEGEGKALEEVKSLYIHSRETLSNTQLQNFVDQLTKFQVIEAKDSFMKARDLWPANPKCQTYLMYIALVGTLALIFLFTIARRAINGMSTFADAMVLKNKLNKMNAKIKRQQAKT